MAHLLSGGIALFASSKRYAGDLGRTGVLLSSRFRLASALDSTLTSIDGVRWIDLLDLSREELEEAIPGVIGLRPAGLSARFWVHIARML